MAETRETTADGWCRDESGALRRETVHNKLRRCLGWDYRELGTYSLTLTLVDRSREWLGRLAGDDARGWSIALTALGEIVERCWRDLAVNWPGVEPREAQVMPDHFHGVLRVATPQRHPLGQIIGSFKAKATAAARALAAEGGTAEQARPHEGGTAEQARPHGGGPHEGGTPAFEAKRRALFAAASHGAVLLSPCVSDGERQLAREALAAGWPLVVLANKGFAKLQKPSGRYFDACAAGKLLMLAPAAWPYQPGKKPMTRLDATAMNRLCQWIAGEGAAEINYHGMKPDNIDALARDAAQVTAVPTRVRRR